MLIQWKYSTASSGHGQGIIKRNSRCHLIAVDLPQSYGYHLTLAITITTSSIMTLHTWLAFFAACWIISFSPGVGAIASLSGGLQYGFLRRYWNTLGLQLGLILQITVVAAGLGTLLTTSAIAFTLIKWFGFAYLIYLAIRQWCTRPQPIDSEAMSRALGHPLSLVLRGALINIGNPKTVIFLLAVTPQFIDPQAPQTPQYLIMGTTMVLVDMIVMAYYTGFAEEALRILRSERQQRRMNQVFASLFILAASLMATLKRNPA